MKMLPTKRPLPFLKDCSIQNEVTMFNRDRTLHGALSNTPEHIAEPVRRMGGDRCS